MTNLGIGLHKYDHSIFDKDASAFNRKRKSFQQMILKIECIGGKIPTHTLRKN